MKYLITILIILFSFNASLAQICGSGTFSLNNQVAVDNFVTAYSSSGCDTIDGDLTIRYANDISGLSFLTTINGNLSLQSNSFANLNGLQNITIIGGYLSISYNASLTSINQLTNNISSSISIENNGVLTDLGIIDTLATINGTLRIYNNNTLSSISFPNLTTTLGLINISFNDSVSNISFPNLVSITSSLSISYNNNLISATGNNFTTANDVTIQNNPLLNNLSLLTTLNTLNGSLIFENNPLLTSIANLTNLTTIPLSLTIRNNGFTLLNGLQNLTTVGAIRIESSNINSLDVFSNITSLNFIRLISLPDLISLNGLENITFINGSTTITSNANLTDISQLDTVTVISGNVNISSNPVLNECCVLTNLFNGNTYVTGNISINANDTNCNSIVSIITSCRITHADDDNDGIINANDNCVIFANTNQEDTDNDGIGDVCDNCPTLSNATQTDTNNDGVGDACQSSSTINTGNSTGGVGIGTTSPKSQLEVAEGDIFINNIHRGVIMKAANGKCFRYQPNSKGVLLGKEITCPDI